MVHFSFLDILALKSIQPTNFTEGKKIMGQTVYAGTVKHHYVCASHCN